MADEVDKHDIGALIKKIRINHDAESTTTSDYLTAQEHRLFGSSSGKREYYENPYTPIAVVDGIITVEECEVIRGRVAVFHVFPSHYGKGDVSQFYGRALLSSLDINPDSPTYGQTLNDPELLNSEYFPEMNPKEAKGRQPFPFKRD
jgi:hypothetical protein